MCDENHPRFPLVVVTDCWLPRLLMWTQGQTDLIKTVALLLMVGDHLSMLCGPDNEWLPCRTRSLIAVWLVWAMNRATFAIAGLVKTRISLTAAEPHLQSGAAPLAARFFSTVLHRAPGSHRIDADVKPAGSG